MDEWIKKIEDVVYVYNGILFNHKKEENPAICDNMDGPWGHYVGEISQRKTNSPRYHLYVESKINNNNKTQQQRKVKLIETESRKVVAMG